MPWIQQSDELCDESTSVFISHAGFNSIAEWVYLLSSSRCNPDDALLSRSAVTGL
jgi:hypothetical protein